MMMLQQQQQQEKASEPLSAASDSLPPVSQIQQHCDDLAAAGFDRTRSLWIGNLDPWMDANYFVNFCNHVNDVVQARVFTHKETTERYAFIEFASPKIADQIMWAFYCVPMPNSKKLFRFKRAEFVCGEKKQAGRPVPKVPYRREDFPPRALVSIDFVRVESIYTPKNPHRLYGTVTVKDVWGFHKLYDRPSEKHEIADVGTYATLTGPVSYISGDGNCLIMIKLGEDEEEIARGYIDLEWRSIVANTDRLLESDVTGNNGSVKVGYSILSNARNANIEVLLIKGDGGEASVYGTIKAVRDIGRAKASYILFDNSDKESVPVCYNHAIPLTRPTVAAPVSTGLTIEADLFDRGGQIVKGTIHFDTKHGLETKEICSKLGKVGVSVFFY